jgi:hypothetical protein
MAIFSYFLSTKLQTFNIRVISADISSMVVISFSITMKSMHSHMFCQLLWYLCETHSFIKFKMSATKDSNYIVN